MIASHITTKENMKMGLLFRRFLAPPEGSCYTNRMLTRMFLPILFEQFLLTKKPLSATVCRENRFSAGMIFCGLFASASPPALRICAVRLGF